MFVGRWIACRIYLLIYMCVYIYLYLFYIYILTRGFCSWDTCAPTQAGMIGWCLSLVHWNLHWAGGHICHMWLIFSAEWRHEVNRLMDACKVMCRPCGVPCCWSLSGASGSHVVPAAARILGATCWPWVSATVGGVAVAAAQHMALRSGAPTAPFLEPLLLAGSSTKLLVLLWPCCSFCCCPNSICHLLASTSDLLHGSAGPSRHKLLLPTMLSVSHNPLLPSARLHGTTRYTEILYVVSPIVFVLLNTNWKVLV